MNVLTIARDLLEAHGCVCTAALDGGVRFDGPLGRGRVDEATTGRLRLRYAVDAAADDPIALAGLSLRVGPAWITLRRRTPVAERICDVGVLVTALRAMQDPEAFVPIPPPPLLDVRVGVLAAVSPPLTTPTFLRLVLPAGDAVDRARATFLLVANAQLRSSKGGWRDGAGLSVTPAHLDPDVLAQELFQVEHALAALDDARLAASYLDLCSMQLTTPPCVLDQDATTREV